MSEILSNGPAVKVGDTVEIADYDYGGFKVQFLKIKRIIISPHGDAFLYGLPLSRTRILRGQLPRKLNELCLILKIAADDERSEEEQALITIPASQVVKKRFLGFTNTEYPGFIYPKRGGQSREEIEGNELLMCRWKLRLVYGDSASRMRGCIPRESSYVHLGEEDAQRRYRVPDKVRLEEWRGGKNRGGSHRPRRHEGPNVSDNEWITPMPGQKYVLDDMFCGGGGTSSGAKQAGFKIGTAVDHDADACASYRLNHPQARMYELGVFEFITSLEAQHLPSYPDVLHLSPPCQTWSPAHTRPGQNDDANSAALFACFQLIEKRRPRIFTVEQTFGIVRDQFEGYFNSFIHAFTMLGYSVRWKVLKLLEYGLYGRRERLVIIGSCPGEKLPTFPKRLYAEHPRPEEGTRPYRTIADALGKMTKEDTPNDHMRREAYFEQPRTPYDANRPLNRCITTGGAQGVYHPNGLRNFSPREMAVLQGFPVNYKFGDLGAGKVKKIVGNAVPPCVAKVLFVHIRKWLEDVDKVRQDPVVISDDEGQDREVIIID